MPENQKTNRSQDDNRNTKRGAGSQDKNIASTNQDTRQGSEKTSNKRGADKASDNQGRSKGRS